MKVTSAVSTGIDAALAKYGINGIEGAKALCDAKGIDPYKMCEQTQPICFENAKWAYVVGAAIAIKKSCKTAAEAAEAIGEGLQAFCIPGSVADDRKVGIGHGNLARPPAARGDRMFRVSCRSRIVRGGGRCHQNCGDGEQGAQKSAAGYPERIGKGRRADYFAYQRLHLRANRVRLCDRGVEDRARESLFRRSPG